MPNIRELLESEIPLLKDFPPEDWNLDLPRLMSFHFGQSYFYPAVAEIDGKIVGCGIGVIHGSVSWLGTIIVLPEYRRQGIGQRITSHLIKVCRGQGCRSHLLCASELGEPIYRKLGFETESMYVFFRRASASQIRDVPGVRPMSGNDDSEVSALDRLVTGEERLKFLERFFPTGWVCESSAGSVNGFYLPDFGGGLIIARNEEAGSVLMKLRIGRGKKTAVIPNSNTCARDFLVSEGFQEYRTSPRMILGEKIIWQPGYMYNRATGYCG
jgi:GNAT superfamily N-acetyltransferase